MTAQAVAESTKMNEHEDEEAQVRNVVERRRLIASLSEQGFEPYDLSPDGTEYFCNRDGEMKMITGSMSSGYLLSNSSRRA